MESVVLQEGRLKGNGSTQNVDTRNMTDLLSWVVGFSTLQFSVEDRKFSLTDNARVMSRPGVERDPKWKCGSSGFSRPLTGSCTRINNHSDRQVCWRLPLEELILLF